MSEAAARQRIDKWLFFARVVKSRSLAARLAQAGRIRVNREKIDQASQIVKPGDVLTITLERRVLVYRIRQAGARRGPAEEARQLYDDLSPPAQVKGTGSEPPAQRDPGEGRPTKKDRRRIDEWRERE